MTDGTNIFATDSDMDMLRDAARGFLAQKWPAERAVAASADTDELRRIWREIGAQGWIAIGADADAGGLRTAALLLQELGRAGCPAPLLDAYLANLMLSRVVDPGAEVADLLARLHRGDIAVSCALGMLDGDPGAGAVSVAGEGAQTRLSGRVAFVEGAALATHLLVVTGRPGEVAIVPCDSAGVTITPTPGYSVPALAEVSFGQAPATLARCGMNDLAVVQTIARLGLASRALGAAERGFDLIVDYAKVRTQFGKKIGQYQAIQHKLVNSLINLDVSRLAILRGAAAFDRGDADWAYAANAAVAVASPALRQACLETHHAFGGVSFWDEHEMPRHFRRIHGDLARCGGVHAARAGMAGYLLDPAG